MHQDMDHVMGASAVRFWAATALITILLAAHFVWSVARKVVS